MIGGSWLEKVQFKAKGPCTFAQVERENEGHPWVSISVRPGQMADWVLWPVAEALKHLVVFEPSKGMVAWRQ